MSAFSENPMHTPNAEEDSRSIHNIFVLFLQKKWIDEVESLMTSLCLALFYDFKGAVFAGIIC